VFERAAAARVLRDPALAAGRMTAFLAADGRPC
jgi:hypothetical protein